jgi:hypothetical protein
MNVTIANISQQNEQVRRHTQSKHSGIRYNGNLCEYKTTTLNMLILHLKTSHEGSRCKPEGITDIFYPKDFKDNPYQIWNFGLFF